jgi:hypothetical protein
MNIMRILNVNGQTPVTSRIFRPWILATVGGLSIGCALLNISSPERVSSYPELGSRAAVYDSSRFRQNYSQASDIDIQSDLSLPLETLFPADETTTLSPATNSIAEDAAATVAGPESTNP